MDRFFVALAVVGCVGGVGACAACVGEYRGGMLAIVELVLVANYLSGHA